MTNAYYLIKRKEIRKHWCCDVPDIDLNKLTASDQYKLGILLNTTDNYSCIKFSQKDNIFTSKEKLSTVLFDFLRKNILVINPKVHVRGFSDDGTYITDISMVRFDINVDLEKYTCILNLIKNGYVYLFDDDFKEIYDDTALSILKLYYEEICKENHHKPEDFIELEPIFLKILSSKTILESLKVINCTFYHYIDTIKIGKKSSFLYELRNTDFTDITGNNYIYRLIIPVSFETKYVFYKLFRLGDICLSLHRDELLDLYRKDHK